MGVSGPQTSPTLLGQLRVNPTDESAWRKFVELYGGHIAAWCRAWGLQDADAEDVTQATLLRLVNALQSFEYDASKTFRGWLKTVAHHVWQDLMRKYRRSSAGVGHGQDPFESATARDDLTAAIEAAYEKEILGVASARVRLRVQQKTWEAFRLTAIENIPATAAAERLAMKLTSVYKARNNVQKMLRDEVQSMEDRPA
jgi:RNA polymerase sigma-70 factor (ECF subfamily)